MTRVQSLANRKSWASIPKEERSRRMSVLAKQRHEKLSPLQRKRIARKMVKAREEKRARS